MAKEQVHNWARYIMLAITIIGVGVGIYTQVHDNSQDNVRQDEELAEVGAETDKKVFSVIAEVAINRTDIKAIERRQDKTEINQERAIKTSESINAALIRMETGNANFRKEVFDEFKEQRTANKVISDKVIETSTKVNTLIKGN